MSLKICTLNTWKCDGRYRDRLKLMAAETARIKPDILMLQEAFAAGEDDTAATLAAAMDGTVAAAPARDKERDFGGRTVRSTSGLAFITTGEIVSSRAVSLPVPDADDNRISQIAEIEIGGKRLLAVATHLTHITEADSERQAEIEATLAALPDLSGYDAALFAGDFNCRPETPPIRWLLEESGVGAIDVCAAAGMEIVTRDTSSRYPPCRIDHIFLLDTGSPVAIDRVTRVYDTRDPTLGIFPSDHYGVMAELRLGN